LPLEARWAALPLELLQHSGADLVDGRDQVLLRRNGPACHGKDKRKSGDDSGGRDPPTHEREHIPSYVD
jgi:hypothetical protein